VAVSCARACKGRSGRGVAMMYLWFYVMLVSAVAMVVAGMKLP
jgi:hypothetical protein